MWDKLFLEFLLGLFDSLSDKVAINSPRFKKGFLRIVFYILLAVVLFFGTIIISGVIIIIFKKIFQFDKIPLFVIYAVEVLLCITVVLILHKRGRKIIKR